LPLYSFSIFQKFPEIVNFTTTRNGGFSHNEMSSFNLGFTVGDETEIVCANRKLLTNALQINSSKLIIPKQTSDIKIFTINDVDLQNIYSGKHEILQDCDAHITDIPNICISVLTADCVPVLLFDPVKKVIAAVHAGWRGTAGKITKLTVLKMVETYNCIPQEIIAGIGISIGPENYEVGSDVYNIFKQVYNQKSSQILRQINEEKMLLNLWEANKIQLIESGLEENNIEVAGICTFQNHEEFYSARFTKHKTGRFATGIMMQN